MKETIIEEEKEVMVEADHNDEMDRDSYGSNYAGESEPPDYEDPDSRLYNLNELLKCNTDGFQLTYSEAKAKGIFERELFQPFTKEEIMRALNNERKKIISEKKEKRLIQKLEKK